MRHVVTQRTVLGLAGFLVLACLLFAEATSRAPDPVTPGAEHAGALAPPAGESAWAAHCAGCHADPLVLAALDPPRAAASGLGDVAAFLARHGAASEAEDRAILEWLWQLAWEDQPPG